MSEPVDIVAEALAVARSWKFLPAKTINRAIIVLADEVERLQAEARIAQVLPLQPQPETVTTTFPKRKQLTRNAAYCDNCKTTIESRHRHDWVQCNCVPPNNGIYVDGGLDYSRRGAGINASYQDLCEYEGDTK